MFDAAKLRIISEYTKYYIKKIPNKSYFLCFSCRFLIVTSCFAISEIAKCGLIYTNALYI